MTGALGVRKGHGTGKKRRIEKKIKQKVLDVNGPKLEIFGSGVFTQIRPAWVGDVGTRPKNAKFWWFRPENRQFVLFSAVADIAKSFKRSRRQRNKIYAVADSANFFLTKQKQLLNRVIFKTIF
jgi:hypothetical protein